MNFVVSWLKPSAPSNVIRSRRPDVRCCGATRASCPIGPASSRDTSPRNSGDLRPHDRAGQSGYGSGAWSRSPSSASSFSKSEGRRSWPNGSAEFKSALLASLAHDLRTPLTTIRVAASNLQASWLTGAQREEQADLVVAEVERLTRLFQNILEMTRIEAGAVVHTCQWVNPLEIVEAARSQIGPTSSAHDVQVLGRSEDRVVHVDPRLTSAALARLLENAAQYSPPGSAITVVHEVNADGLLVTVEDQGRGIADADGSRLFEPFFRGEQGGRHGAGTGMGLAIARGLLAAEHGRVWAENRPEGGARFSIMVPALSRPALTAADEA